jgi:hypothetical protein
VQEHDDHGIGDRDTVKVARQQSHRRRGLWLLDRCLDELEDANERDETRLSPALARLLSGRVPSLEVGMPITAALDAVFEEQDRYLRPRVESDGGPYEIREGEDREDGGSRSPGRVGSLDAPAARALTNRIRSATRDVCLLLLEAHQGRAWVSLGHATWEEYVHGELGLSRSRSYELMDQARVIQELRAAAGVRAVVDLSAYAATQIKPRLGQVCAEVRARAAGASEQRAMAVVAEVVREERALMAESRRQARAERHRPRPAVQESHLLRLREAVDLLAGLPPVAEVARLGPGGDGPNDERLDSALRWLLDFVEERTRQARSTSTPRVKPAPRGVLSGA